MYSNDRRKALDCTLECLGEMDGFEECQKTLVVDGRLESYVAGWDVVQIPRIDGKFCWGRMWDAGVGTARHQKIVYMDSDRLLPNNFLSRMVEEIRDNTFVSTSIHFQALKELDWTQCKNVLYRLGSDDTIFADDVFIGNFFYEVRHQKPYHGPGKNVMSGSVGFTRKSYLKSGGVDHWYCGHGAFADTDYHMQTARLGYQFIDLKLPELHYYHTKDNYHRKDLEKMSFTNFSYYCQKWGLPNILVKNVKY